MLTITCPKCGATLSVKNTSREFVFCEYCGEKLEIAPFVRQATETDVQSNEKDSKKTLLCVALCVVMLLGGIIVLYSYNSQKQARLQYEKELARLEDEQIAYSHLVNGEVQMPAINTNGNYGIVRQRFEDAGFTNITTKAIGDLSEAASSQYNQVIQVTVNGIPRLNVGSWFPTDTPIVITYHTVNDTLSSSEQETQSIAPDSSSSMPTTWDEIANNAINKINDLADSTYQGLDSLAEQYGVSVSRPED